MEARSGHVPFVLVGYVQMTVVLILGKLLFDIPMRGSIPLLYLVTLGFIVATLGMGLLVSTIAQRWSLALAPGHPIVPQPLVTLRTKYGMRMTISQRSSLNAQGSRGC